MWCGEADLKVQRSPLVIALFYRISLVKSSSGELTRGISVVTCSDTEFGQAMRVGYVRVSKGEQEEALVQQTARVNKAGVVLMFSDIESGKNDKRINFNKLLAMCRDGNVTEVVVTRLDRLARSVITIHRTMAMFEEMNVKLIVLDAPVDDSSSPFGWFSMNQMAGLAEFESRLLQSRVNHGMAFFREQNKAKTPPFGYARINEKYAPDLTVHVSGKTHWQIATEIIVYFLSNQASLRNTIQHFIKTYNIKFSPPGLRGWLLNPTLQGHTRYNVKYNRVDSSKWDVRENTHLALISKETYKQIEARLVENKRLWGKNFGGSVGRADAIGNYLLSGQILCGYCGGKVYVHDKKKSMAVRCKQRRMYGDSVCTNKAGVYLIKVITAVDEALTTKAIEIKNYVVTGQPDNEDSPEMIELKNKIEVLQKLPPDSIIDEAIEKTILKVQQLQQKNIQVVKFGTGLQKELVDAFSDIDFFKTLPEENKRQLYKRFVKYVKVLNGNIIEVALIDILL